MKSLLTILLFGLISNTAFAVDCESEPIGLRQSQLSFFSTSSGIIKKAKELMGREAECFDGFDIDNNMVTPIFRPPELDPNSTADTNQRIQIAYGQRYSQCFFERLDKIQISNIVSQLIGGDAKLGEVDFDIVTCMNLEGHIGSRIHLNNEYLSIERRFLRTLIESMKNTLK